MQWGNIVRVVVVWIAAVMLATLVSALVKPPPPGSFLIGLVIGFAAVGRALRLWPLWRD